VRYADGELRQNYYFFADLSDSNKIFLPSNEGITQWYPLSDTGDLSMPFTARHMLDHYITIGQFDNALYGGIANDAGVTFTKL
jgi:8-oxo-dGTP diphosphatase